jgi:hypothetical protein
MTGLASVGGATTLTGVSVILDQPYGGNVSANANGGNTGAAVVGAEGTAVGLVVGLSVDGENVIRFDGLPFEGASEGPVDGALDGIVVNIPDDDGVEGCLPTSAAIAITTNTTNAKKISHPRRPKQQGSR